MRSTIVLTLVVLGGIGLLVCQQARAADQPVKVYVDGHLAHFSPPAVVRNGTTYVPLRAGAEAVGATVKWHAATNSATVSAANGCSMHISQSKGIMVNNHLLLPLRLMGQATGAKVQWDATAKAVRISKAAPAAAAPAAGGG